MRGATEYTPLAMPEHQTVKLLINSTISTPNAKYMTMDKKDFYLNTPMV